MKANLKEQAEDIQQLMTQVRHCLLCPIPTTPAISGVWIPSPEISKRIGAPKGKLRTVVYGLCEYHHDKKFLPEVERLILKKLTVN